MERIPLIDNFLDLQIQPLAREVFKLHYKTMALIYKGDRL